MGTLKPLIKFGQFYSSHNKMRQVTLSLMSVCLLGLLLHVSMSAPTGTSSEEDNSSEESTSIPIMVKRSPQDEEGGEEEKSTLPPWCKNVFRSTQRVHGKCKELAEEIG